MARYKHTDTSPRFLAVDLMVCASALCKASHKADYAVLDYVKFRSGLY